MATSEQMTEYERRRLDNIKRNSEMLASLNVQSRLTALSTKRPREEKSYKQTLDKKKPEAPLVIRRSLRTRGVAPDSKGLPMDFNDSHAKSSKSKTIKLSNATETRLSVKGPLSMKDVYEMEEGSYRAIIEKFTNMSKSQLDGEREPLTKCNPNGGSTSSSNVERVNLEEPMNVKSLNLEPENIARVVPGRIFSIRFLPTTSMTMVIAGNKYGHLGFWDVKPQKGDEDVLHLYQPHTAPVSGIYVHPFSLSKVYTSSYDGFIRLMDIAREEFDLVYSSSSESAIYSLSQQQNDANSVYLGEGKGVLNVLDGRTRKLTNSWSLHEDRINTIDFSPTNPNIMVTSSTDGLACLWDIRKVDAEHPEHSALQSINHGRAVHSAYFSPSGSNVATTSVDDNIGVLSGINFEGKFTIPLVKQMSEYERSRLENIKRNSQMLASLKVCSHVSGLSPKRHSVARSVDGNIGVLGSLNYKDKFMIPHENWTNRWISPFRATWGWDDTHLFVGHMKRRVDVVSVDERKTITTLESPLMSAIPCRYDAHPCTVGMLAGSTAGGQVYIWTASL